MSADGQLRAIQQLMRDMSFECSNERHVVDGKPIIVVDEDGKPSGTGYYAYPDGTKFGDNPPEGWPEKHRATPCGKCWGCRLVILGCGYLDVIDGRGACEMKYRKGRFAVVRIRRMR